MFFATQLTVVGAVAVALLGIAGLIAVVRGLSKPDGGPNPLEQRLKVFAEAQTLASVGCCRFDLPSGGAMWSDEMFRIAGLTPGTNAPGFWAFPDIIHPEDREEVRRQLNETAGGGVTFDAEFRIVCPDGTVKSIHGVARREVEEDPDIIRIFAAFLEITGYKSETNDLARSLAEAEAAQAETEAARTQAETARTQAEAARAEAETARAETETARAETETARTEVEVAQAEAETARTALAEVELASRAKSDFLALMSHELRTPLNSILGFAEIIREQMFGAVGSDRYVSYARDISESGEHLLGVVNDILDLSKVEAGRMELHEETVDLLAVIQEATTLVQERATDKGLTLRASMPQSLPFLNADERLVKQMLINLLSNAVNFTPGGGWVAVTAERSRKGGITLAVADSGIGIEPEDLPRVLMPFHAKNEPLAQKSHGTGLGLPLVKSLIELHGGEFHIKSTPKVGTTVVLSFPRDRVIEGGLKVLGEIA
ncbi:MAG: PAS domain-containing sensor histidine kinase [Rhodospirillales bacterium]